MDFKNYQFTKTCRRGISMLLLLTVTLITHVQAQTNKYAIPTDIPQGNILHCFNWPMNEVKNALPEIAEAGFGSVQISPLQRPDIKAGYAWHDLYRPYDLAFKASAGMGSETDLRALCQEAAKYGIKIIVDVVANHVDKTAGYHDTWWDSNGRVRWNGGINYGDRYSITHGQLGDYGDVNSENSEVIARGKAYVEFLSSCGVRGVRWDAAKHIGLPSEGCQFWSTVTQVPGVWHYGEILDKPGPDEGIIKEYANYMSVTDNEYCNYAARNNGGIPGGYGGNWAVNYGLGNKCVYWAESHDTYSNDDWSCNVDQSVIDRAYAAYACRLDATCLYFSRPNARGFNNIKVGKGSTHFTSKQVAEVNKFRNAMTGKRDYFSTNGNACSITRENGGAVIVMKGSGNVSIANGGGYCSTGTYTDRVSGGKFTVTSSTISGNVGPSGIAVIYKDDDSDDGDDGGDDDGDDPIVVPPASDNLITDYYKVNPNGHYGTEKTVSMSFTGPKSNTALNNWKSEDLIAQGVARDVAQAFKGVHERPIVDSYALYAAYDNDHLYLGAQFVYTVWDLGGEGKQPGESKPYNMDGHMCWAFDLDDNKSFDGLINGTGPIWSENADGATFNNGVDAVWMCSTKPGNGTPGFFIPTPDGHASYDAAYCKSISVDYGYEDGLLPSISHIWGQGNFGYNPTMLQGNQGFVDLKGEIDETAHTFYEWRFKLSDLGITADYIKNHGIGVMYIDKYGTSPVGGTPYDPSYFDNVFEPYSKDKSTSKEKEDKDIITYKPARIGKPVSTAIQGIETETAAQPTVYYNMQGVRVAKPQKGVYIIKQGNKAKKVCIK